MTRRMQITTSLVLVLFLAGCQRSVQVQPPNTQDVLRATAQALEAVSIAANTTMKTILAVMPEPTEDRAKILSIIAKVVEADQRGVNLVRQFEGVDLGSVQQIANLVRPVFNEIREAIHSGLVGIKNPESQAKAQAYLTSIEAAVNALQAILEIYGVA